MHWLYFLFISFSVSLILTFLILCGLGIVLFVGLCLDLGLGCCCLVGCGFWVLGRCHRVCVCCSSWCCFFFVFHVWLLVGRLSLLTLLCCWWCRICVLLLSHRFVCYGFFCRVFHTICRLPYLSVFFFYEFSVDVITYCGAGFASCAFFWISYDSFEVAEC